MKYVLTTIAAASFPLLGACKGEPAKKGQPATPVRVASAARINAPVTILASGVVEPMQTVAVTAQVTGTLLSVDFKEGDVVQKGQVLFHIDPRPLQATVDQVRATLGRDEAQLAAGRKDDERYSKLADMGYVSRSQADQMHATAEAQAATVRADQAALRAAEVNLGFATIRAPIAGRTGSLLVRQGNNVSPGGSPLVVINQLSPVLVRFPVLSSDFDPLQRAVSLHPVNVRAASSDSMPTNESGTLDFLDNAIDSLTGTVTGKARFANADRRMWPGELVFLTVELDVQRGVIAVPTEAIQTGQQGPYVYVVDQTNTAKTRPIMPGIQVDSLTVVQRGLNAGERVVIDGQSRLNPNARVAIAGARGDSSGAQLGGNATGESGTASGDIVAGRAGQPGAAEPSSAGNGGGNGGGAGAPGAGGGANGSAGAAGGRASPNLPPPISGSPGVSSPNASTPNPASSASPTTRAPITNAPATNAPAANAPVTRPPTTTTAPTTAGTRPPTAAGRP